MAMKQWLKRKGRDPSSENESALAENPEPRSQCVLVLDNSSSMGGDKIAQVNQGLIDFLQILRTDEMASERVELAIVTFGGSVKIAQEFVLAKDFTPPQLTAGGDTPLCEAVCEAGRLIRERRQLYKEFEIDSFRPFVVVITDGYPNSDDSIEAAQQMVRDFESATNPADQASFFFFGVEGADMKTLNAISKRPAMKIRGAQFRQVFPWAGLSVRQISTSNVGDNVELPQITKFLKLDLDS